MTKPLYLLQTKIAKPTCLGSQLISLLEKLDILLGECTWYATDVDLNILYPSRPKWDTPLPCCIGNSQALKKQCILVDQFLSGVFLAYPQSKKPSPGIKFGTEDERFRDMDNAILEIRAFDTSFFEIYSNDKNLLQLLLCYYGGSLFDRTVACSEH